MTRRISIGLAAATIAVALATVANVATAQSNAKKALVQRVLQAQQAEIESIAHTVIERPVAMMMQQAGRAIQASPADKREALGRAVDAETRKYIDEAYPLVRERALKIAPSTIGTILETRMSEEELTQLVAWLESPVARKYQQLGDDMRNAFIEKLLAESQPVVDPKLQALDARLRTIFGVARPPGAAGSSPAAPPSRAPTPAARAASR